MVHLALIVMLRKISFFKIKIVNVILQVDGIFLLLIIILVLKHVQMEHTQIILLLLVNFVKVVVLPVVHILHALELLVKLVMTGILPIKFASALMRHFMMLN